MSDKIIKTFDVWITAQGLKSKGRLRSVDNISLEGIARVRELILELALRGKLVPQNPNDEPAKVLLTRIAQKKEELISNGDLRRPKVLPDSNDSSFVKFELPRGWEWAKLDSIAPMSLCDGDWIETIDQDSNGSIRLIQLADIGEGYFIDKSQKFINESTFTRLNCTELQTGDILIARLPSPIGRACIFPGIQQKSITVVDVAILRSLKLFFEPFIVNAINSKTFRSQVEAFGKGVTRFRISTGNLKSILMPIPPLAEQNRIVAKVDELMALCDELEKQETHHLKSHQLLVETLLGTLTQANNAAEFETAWSRLAQHFDDIFTTEGSIDQLKQTILQLAVMGKLVPQDPNDEPASELLNRIEKEKERLVKDGKIRNENPLPKISEDEIPFQKPKGWEFARLGQITNKIGSGSTPRGGKESYVNDGILFLRSQNIWDNGLELSDVAYITEETHESMANTKVIANDILLNITGGSLGRSTIVPEDLGEANVSQHVTIIRPTAIETRFFLHLCILSPYGQNMIWGRQVGANREGLSKKVLELFEIPIPPINEQVRIVKKVDALFALCDRLKERIAESQKVVNQMADSILEQVD